MKLAHCLAAAAMLLCVLASAADLPQWDFEKDIAGWVTLDKQAELKQTTDPAHVHEGAASLQFSFTAHAAEGDEMPGILAVEVPAGIAGAACLHLAVQTSVSGPCILVLREQDESSYMTPCYFSAGDWHVLDLPIAEFRLDENGKDENGVLDLDQVNMLGIADLGHFLSAAMAQGNIPFYYERPSRRDLWLDDVRMLAECPSRLSAPQIPGTVMLEDCDSDSAYFMVFGGRNLKVESCADPAVRGNSLRLDYEIPSQTIVAISRQVAAGALEDARGITFSVRSGAAIPLLVMIEEDDRSRYNKLVEVAAGHWETPVITWGDMTLGDDSQDPDQGLQPEKIRSITFVDAATLIGQKETANTLWLDEITTAP